MATSSSSESNILFVLLSLFWLRNISIYNVYRYVCLLLHSEVRVFCWCRNCSAIVPTCWNSNMKVRELKLDVPRLLVLRNVLTGRRPRDLPIRGVLSPWRKNILRWTGPQGWMNKQRTISCPGSEDTLTKSERQPKMRLMQHTDFDGVSEHHEQTVKTKT